MPAARRPDQEGDEGENRERDQEAGRRPPARRGHGAAPARSAAPVDKPRQPRRQGAHDRAALRVGVAEPAADLVERASAALAKPARTVDDAKLDAGRDDARAWGAAQAKAATPMRKAIAAICWQAPSVSPVCPPICAALIRLKR